MHFVHNRNVWTEVLQKNVQPSTLCLPDPSALKYDTDDVDVDDDGVGLDRMMIKKTSGAILYESIDKRFNRWKGWFSSFALLDTPKRFDFWPRETLNVDDINRDLLFYF